MATNTTTKNGSPSLEQVESQPMAQAQAQTVPFDLGTTRIESEYQWMDILHPVTGDETGARLYLAGAGTKTFQQAESAKLNERLKQVATNRNLRKMRKDLTADDLQESELGLLVALTKDWDGLVIDGQAVPFTPEKTRQLYTDFPWLFNQAKNFVNDMSNFIGS